MKLVLLWVRLKYTLLKLFFLKKRDPHLFEFKYKNKVFISFGNTKVEINVESPDEKI